jgi:hypothetical protein
VVYHAGNHKTPNIQLVDPNAMVRHCLMVPHEDIHSSYHKSWGQDCGAMSSTTVLDLTGGGEGYGLLELVEDRLDGTCGGPGLLEGEEAGVKFDRGDGVIASLEVVKKLEAGSVASSNGVI